MSQLNRGNAGGPVKTFGRDHSRAMIAGVCAGIARYFRIDPLIVRVIFAVGAIAGFGTFILVYLAIWLLAD